MKRILNRILGFLVRYWKVAKLEKDTIQIPVFHIAKHYSDMTKAEKRQYRKWLVKNNMWDGAELVERLERTKRLNLSKSYDLAKF